jgi:ParB-like chromosome segregation protein Spo0J
MSANEEAPAVLPTPTEAEKQITSALSISQPPAQSVQIDREFRDLIPPMTSEERAGLEANILLYGCHQPLVVWNGILIDGHNRYAICAQHGIQFETKPIHFDDRHAAMIWIIRNQFDRRNLSPAQRMDLALLLKSEIQTQAQVRMRAGVAVDPVQNSAQGKTRDEVAKLAGVSHDTLTKYEKVKATAAPEVVEAVRAGRISINAAVKAVKASSPVERADVVTEPEPAQEVTSDTKARKISWQVWAKNKWIARAKYADNVVVTKRTIKGEVLFEVEYEHCKRKDKVPSLSDAKALGETFIQWRVDAARRAGR